MQKSILGQSIEALVCAFLEANGLVCLHKNYLCRLGEIDLVMFEASNNSLVFVEVRFRATASHGDATTSVDWKKQRKLRRTVLHYLQKHADARQVARVDVVGVCEAGVVGCDAASSVDGVSVHQFRGYELVWTRNAVEG